MLCSECSRPVKPVVAVDIDGTLGNYHQAFTDFAERYVGRVLPYDYDGVGNFEDFLGLTQVEYRAAKLAYRQGGSKRWMEPYPYAAMFVNELRRAGAEVYIATTRPWQRLDNIDPDTQEWLRRNQMEVDGLLFGDDKYDQLVSIVEKERIIAVVDDLPEQFDHAVSLGLPAFQVERQHNSGVGCERHPRRTLWGLLNSLLGVTLAWQGAHPLEVST